MERFGGTAFSVKGTASGKALRWELTWHLRSRKGISVD